LRSAQQVEAVLPAAPEDGLEELPTGALDELLAGGLEELPTEELLEGAELPLNVLPDGLDELPLRVLEPLALFDAVLPDGAVAELPEGAVAELLPDGAVVAELPDGAVVPLDAMLPGLQAVLDELLPAGEVLELGGLLVCAKPAPATVSAATEIVVNRSFLMVALSRIRGDSPLPAGCGTASCEWRGRSDRSELYGRLRCPHSRQPRATRRCRRRAAA
jgi:hypothetical protein